MRRLAVVALALLALLAGALGAATPRAAAVQKPGMCDGGCPR